MVAKAHAHTNIQKKINTERIFFKAKKKWISFLFLFWTCSRSHWQSVHLAIIFSFHGLIGSHIFLPFSSRSPSEHCLGTWYEPVNICLRYSGRNTPEKLRWGWVHVNHPWRWTVMAISKSTISLLSKVRPLPLSPCMCVHPCFFFFPVQVVLVCLYVFSSQLT